jgi:hypothetical protein
VSTPIPQPPIAGLNTDEALSAYLVDVVQRIRRETGSTEVAVYLVDAAAGRLSLRAWTSSRRSGVVGDEKTPEDLTDHGIEGAALSAKTLGHFVGTAPRGRRIAAPVGNRSSWMGALVGVAERGLTEADESYFVKAARELGEALDREGVRARRLQVSETDQTGDLEPEPIFGRSLSPGTAYAAAAIYNRGLARRGGTTKVEESRDAALRRLDRAIETTREQLERLTSDVRNDLFDVVSLLFSTHVLMLTDDSFSGAMRSLVEAGQTPEDAVQAVVASFVRTFRNLREARLAELAQDVRDIGHRIRHNLAGTAHDGRRLWRHQPFGCTGDGIASGR